MAKKTKDYVTKKFGQIKQQVDALNENPERKFTVKTANERILAQRHARRLVKERKSKCLIKTAELKTKTGKPKGFLIFAV